MLRRQLYGIQHAQHFIEIPAGAHRIGDDQLDQLIRTDDKHGTDCGIVRRGPLFRGAAGVRVDHVVELGHLQVAVAYQRIVDCMALGFLDVVQPGVMVIDRIDAQADNLGVAFVKLRLEPGHVSQFRRADRGKILGMGKQDGIAVANPVMEIDRSFCGVNSEIRRFIANT